VVVAWNVLAGFPGEPISEYERMAELVPSLMHLPPPTSCFQIRLDRFSPYFTEATRHGLRRIRPHPAYFYVYPLGRRELARLAYFFDFDHPDGRKPDDYIAPLKREVARWWQARLGPSEARPSLDAFCHGGRVRIRDTRPCATRAEHRLEGLEAAIYVECDTAQTAEGIGRRLGGAVDSSRIHRAFEALERSRLMAHVEGRHASLAVFRDRGGAAAPTGELTWRR
jgi:hypothetical protein